MCEYMRLSLTTLCFMVYWFTKPRITWTTNFRIQPVGCYFILELIIYYLHSTLRLYVVLNFPHIFNLS